jgi:DNA-binding response OmpR family regulator
MQPNILLVIESNHGRNFLQLMLTHQDFKVITAIDGAQGFSIAQADKPDLIITDLYMPNMDGIDFVKQVRSQLDIASTPIFICTAQCRTVLNEPIDPGTTKIFYTPFNVMEMIFNIHETIQARKSSANLLTNPSMSAVNACAINSLSIH